MHVLNHGMSNIPPYLPTDHTLYERRDLAGVIIDDILDIITSKKSLPLTAARRPSVSVSVREHNGSISISTSLPQISKGQDTTTVTVTATDTHSDTGVVLITQYFRNSSPDSPQQRDMDKVLGINIGNSYISLIILLTEELLNLPGTVRTYTNTNKHTHSL